jgi:hypothetical protein
MRGLEKIAPQDCGEVQFVWLLLGKCLSIVGPFSDMKIIISDFHRPEAEILRE